MKIALLPPDFEREVSGLRTVAGASLQ